MKAVAHALRLFAGAWIALVTLDVLVHLAELLVDRDLLANWRDFAGLAACDAQVALPLALASALGAALTTYIPGGHGWRSESVALCAGALAAVGVATGARIAWLAGPEALPAAAGAAAGAALFVWFVARRLAAPERDDRTLGSVVAALSYTALLVGCANEAVAQAVRDRFWPALAYFVAASFALRLGWVAASLGARGPATTALRFLPALAALGLAVTAVARSGTYGAGASFGGPAATEASPLPPIFLIVVDTLRADHLARYGYARDTMPLLERWARDARVAERAVSPGGWTAPAHASLFSGRTVSGHGVHNDPPSGRAEYRFHTPPREDVEWLPERLSARGYRTLAVSANGLALPGVTGFDRVFVPERGAFRTDSVAALADHESPVSGPLSDRLRWRIPYADARQIVDITLRALPPGDGPVFAFVNLLDPHSPYNPPPRALRALALDPPRLFGRYRSHAELTRMWQRLPPGAAGVLADLYDGELRHADTHLGRLLRHLDERYAGRATVIVTSDHGEELGEEGRVGHEHGLPQRLVHVPLFVKGPGIAPGVLREPLSTRRVFHFVDALSRGEGPRPELLVDDREPVLSERYASARNVAGLGADHARNWVALYDGALKGVGPSDEGFALHDVSDFTRDAAADGTPPERAEALRERIDTWWRSHRDERAATGPSPNAVDRDALRALGYAE